MNQQSERASEQRVYQGAYAVQAGNDVSGLLVPVERVVGVVAQVQDQQHQGVDKVAHACTEVWLAQVRSLVTSACWLQPADACAA